MASNNDIIAKTSDQSVLSPLPSSGGVRYRDMMHEDIIQCSVINIFWPLVSVHFPYHWVKEGHSNCVILNVTLFFTYIVDETKAKIQPGTPESDCLRMLLPFMSAGLTGEQELA